MAKQYWVGEFFVDLSRNQISQLGHSQTLPPKALLVLTHLAENRGNVVSYDELLDKVWPNSVVTPNTLQRCITQLRKALKENSKAQSIIKTHAKQGYSLECDVSWQVERAVDTLPSVENQTEEVEEIEQVEETVAPKVARSSLRVVTALAALLLCVIALGVYVFKPFESKPLFSITAIQAMTATDDSEFYATYSVGGDYIIFSRAHHQTCQSRIWAKHIATQQETLLTPSWGYYQDLALSPDGSQLVFIDQQRCWSEPSTPQCFYLKHMSFQQALEGNSDISTLMTCSDTELKKPIWLTNNDVVLMHNLGRQWQLLKYDISDGSSEIFYQPHEGNLLTYDISHEKSRIALVRVSESNQPVLDLLNARGEGLSSHMIDEHANIPRHRLFGPKFIPHQDLLLFSTGRQLFSLSFDGRIERITLPLDEGMSTPLFKQDGTRALVTKGSFDSDIGLVKIEQPNARSPLVITEDSIDTIARTNAREAKARFHPDGDSLVFKSSRSGTPQLWLSQGDALTQLTDFPIDSRIKGFRWAKDGKSLLVNAEGELVRVYLNSTQSRIPAQEPLVQLFYWDSDTNMAIGNMWIKGVKSLVEINLASGEYLTLKGSPVLWADKSPEGRLVYLDHNYQFWLSGAAEDLYIDDLDGQGSYRQFILEGETIYGINSEKHLWTYDLPEKKLTMLARLPNHVNYLTDIRGDSLLLSYVIAAKKEIVELEVAY